MFSQKESYRALKILDKSSVTLVNGPNNKIKDFWIPFWVIDCFLKCIYEYTMNSPVPSKEYRTLKLPRTFLSEGIQNFQDNSAIFTRRHKTKRKISNASQLVDKFWLFIRKWIYQSCHLYAMYCYYCVFIVAYTKSWLWLSYAIFRNSQELLFCYFFLGALTSHNEKNGSCISCLLFVLI